MMNERQLGEALLRGESAVDAAALTEKVLRRDRRRMWGLGLVCVVAWMMVVMLPWATVLPMVAKLVHLQAEAAAQQWELNQNNNAATMVWSAKELAGRANEITQVVKVGTMATFFGSIGSMLVAAVCTVMLVVLSRRATLRQVNARLAEIAGELRRMGDGGR